MTIVLVFFALCVLAYIVMAIMNRLNRKWTRLPHFVYNYVGGVWAVCSITDFKKALKAGQKIGNFVWVKDTLIFGTYGVSEGMSGILTGGIFTGLSGLYPAEGDFDSRQQNVTLFVPFTSSKHLTFDEQAKTFIKRQDPVEFAKRKRFENLQVNFRFRFVKWMGKKNFEGYQGGACGLALLSVFIVLFGFVGGQNDKDRNEQFGIYTTPNGVVHETKMTISDATRLPMYHRSAYHFELVSGKVAQVQILGEMTARACLVRENHTLICGFAPPTLKVGDDVFVRSGYMMTWAESSTGKSYDVDDAWIISKKEADALVATGKFKVIK